MELLSEQDRSFFPWLCCWNRVMSRWQDYRESRLLLKAIYIWFPAKEIRWVVFYSRLKKPSWIQPAARFEQMRRQKNPRYPHLSKSWWSPLGPSNHSAQPPRGRRAPQVGAAGVRSKTQDVCCWCSARYHGGRHVQPVCTLSNHNPPVVWYTKCHILWLDG